MTEKELCAALLSYGSTEPEAETRLILSELFSVSPAMQKCDRGRDYTSDALMHLLRRREEGEPLAYILGHRFFFREDYELSKDTLIPRRETELLVENGIALLPPNGSFADLCTGSGCVAVSLAAARRDATGVAVDINEGAVRMARRNAQKNGVSDRVRFAVGDVLKAPDACKLLHGQVHLILSNPPYIPTSALASLPPDVQKEPVSALDGGTDGMTFYRHILSHYQKALLPGGLFLFEIGFDQAEKIKEEAARAGCSCRIQKDTSGNPRVACVRKADTEAYDKE